MKITTKEFYQELETITNEIIDFTKEHFASLSKEELLRKPSPEKWSVGECLQHLVQYGEFYLEAMKAAIEHSSPNTPKEVFKAGYFGNKFTEMLRYQEVGMKKMKAPKIKSLTFVEVEENVVEIFLAQQQQHLKVLTQSKKINLEKVKVPIALTKFIKTKIGDTLRFTIYHNQRHFIQAKKVLELVK